MLALIAPGNYVGSIAGGSCKTVATAGTRVQFTTSKFPVEGCCVQALETNSGYVAVGGADVVAIATASRICFCVLAPGASAIVPITDLKNLWFDSTANGNIVSVGPLR